MMLDSGSEVCVDVIIIIFVKTNNVKNTAKHYELSIIWYIK